MSKKIWFEIWGVGPATDAPALLARVKSPGLATIVANALREHYSDVEIR